MLVIVIVLVIDSWARTSEFGHRISDLGPGDWDLAGPAILVDRNRARNRARTRRSLPLFPVAPADDTPADRSLLVFKTPPLYPRPLGNYPSQVFYAPRRLAGLSAVPARPVARAVPARVVRNGETAVGRNGDRRANRQAVSTGMRQRPADDVAGDIFPVPQRRGGPLGSPRTAQQAAGVDRSMRPARQVPPENAWRTSPLPSGLHQSISTRMGGGHSNSAFKTHNC